MKVLFLNERFKRLCESRTERVKRFGEPAAVKLKARLDDLDAASSLEDMRHLAGHWEELRSDRAGQLSCRLAGGLRLIIRTTQQPAPAKPDGGLEWRAVDQVTVLEVVDYHE